MTARHLLLFGNVSQPPFCNNLFPAGPRVPARLPNDGRRAAALPRIRVDRRRPAGARARRRGPRAHGSLARRRRLPRRSAPLLRAVAAGAAQPPCRAGRVRALRSVRSGGLAEDRARVRPLLHAGSPGGARLPRRRRHGATLRSRHRSRAVRAAARAPGPRMRRRVLRKVDSLPRRDRLRARRARARARSRLRGRQAVERSGRAAPRHAGGAPRRAQCVAPGARDREARRRRGEVPRRVSNHAEARSSRPPAAFRR